jgi:hypothetical protein
MDILTSFEYYIMTFRFCIENCNHTCIEYKNGTTFRPLIAPAGNAMDIVTSFNTISCPSCLVSRRPSFMYKIQQWNNPLATRGEAGTVLFTYQLWYNLVTFNVPTRKVMPLSFLYSTHIVLACKQNNNSLTFLPCNVSPYIFSIT